MSRLYPVFVPLNDIGEGDIEYSDVVDWCYAHLNHPNVLVLNLSDIYLLQNETIVLDIINEENGSILQLGEDDWVIENDRKNRILKRLKTYLIELPIGRKKEIVISLIQLLLISIDTNKNLYFVW